MCNRREESEKNEMIKIKRARETVKKREESSEENGLARERKRKGKMVNEEARRLSM